VGGARFLFSHNLEVTKLTNFEILVPLGFGVDSLMQIVLYLLIEAQLFLSRDTSVEWLTRLV
jgi:hypothetical protein